MSVNSFSTRTFPIERGVRQWCPLLAALFIISKEPFLQLIKRITPKIHLPAIGYGVPVFAFTDVTVIVGNAEHVARITKACEIYETISAAKINKEKSEVLLLGSSLVDKDEVYGLPVKNNVKIPGSLFDREGPAERKVGQENKGYEGISKKKLEKVKCSLFTRIKVTNSGAFEDPLRLDCNTTK